MALILAAAVSASFYVDDGYTVSGYFDDLVPSQSESFVAPARVKQQDTIGIFPVSSSLVAGARTVSTGFVSDSTGRHILAPWIVVSTGMAASATSEMDMPFGMSIDVAAVNPENPYAVDGYVVDDYWIDPRTGLTSTVIAPNRVREPLMVTSVSSETDVAVTQVHTTGVQVDGQSSVVGFGARIQNTGMAVNAGVAGFDNIPDALLEAAASNEPEATVFSVVINGRLLGDVNNNGSITSADALEYLKWLGGIASAEINAYIETVMNPYMLANRALYSPYLTFEAETIISGSKVMDFGYLTEGQSAVDIGPSLIRTYGALVDGVSTTVIAPNFTGTFGVASSAQSAVLTGAKVTMVAGALSTASSSVIISARLKWEAVPEPATGWTVINDDNYPFG